MEIHTIRVGAGAISQKVGAIFGRSKRRFQRPIVQHTSIHCLYTTVRLLWLTICHITTHTRSLIHIRTVHYHLRDFSILSKVLRLAQYLHNQIHTRQTMLQHFHTTTHQENAIGRWNSTISQTSLPHPFTDPHTLIETQNGHVPLPLQCLMTNSWRKPDCAARLGCSQEIFGCRALLCCLYVVSLFLLPMPETSWSNLTDTPI